jgi:hypothetical protein
MKLISVLPARDGIHKYAALFESEGRNHTTKFGAHGMDDYTKTHDKEQRERYRTRHKKDLLTGEPDRAGFLSYYILWGNSTSIKANIASYRRRFDL